MQHEILATPIFRQFFKLVLFLLVFDFATRVFLDKNVTKETKNQANNTNNENKKIENNETKTNIKEPNNDIELNQNGFTDSQNNKLFIKYCNNCGYKEKFDSFKSEIEAVIPDILVEGGEMEPMGFNKYLKYLLYFIQYSIILLFLFGENLAQKFNIVLPPIYYQIKEKKIIFLVFMYFGFNFLQSKLSCTGAFEVFLNNDLIYSKLRTNSLPTINFLVNKINNMLKI